MERAFVVSYISEGSSDTALMCIGEKNLKTGALDVIAAYAGEDADKTLEFLLRSQQSKPSQK